jgi:hypothetical protein
MLKNPNAHGVSYSTAALLKHDTPKNRIYSTVAKRRFGENRYCPRLFTANAFPIVFINDARIVATLSLPYDECRRTRMDAPAADR